jgi:hypothetical protein
MNSWVCKPSAIEYKFLSGWFCPSYAQVWRTGGTVTLLFHDSCFSVALLLTIAFVFVKPPPPVNDTNPYNVFRPREKAHRLHTRRMQRRENNIQSFEKLRMVRRNLDQAKALMDALVKVSS